jgi:hypothetical protein
MSREVASKFKAGKCVGYILQNQNGGAFISVNNLKAFCKLWSLKELVWGKKQYVILVANGNRGEAENEGDDKVAVGYIGLSKNHKYFYLIAREHGVECMGWTSLLARFLKGEAKRCPVHERIPNRETIEVCK